MRTPRTWRLGIGAVVVLVLAGAVLVGWTWRHPTVLADEQRRVGASTAPGEPVYVGLTFPGERDDAVEIDHAEVDDAPGGIDVAFWVCTIADPELGAIGAAHEDDVDETCSTLEPAEGATLSLGTDPRQQLLLAVTPVTRGLVEVEITGVDVTYSHGWQHGTQRLGSEVSVRSG